MSVPRRAMRLAWLLDQGVMQFHGHLALACGIPPRRAAAACAHALPPVVMALMAAGLAATGLSWLPCLLVPALLGAVVLASGMPAAGPPRLVAADPISRLVALSTLVAVSLMAAMVTVPAALPVMGVGAAAAALLTAALHFEALPPQPPRRRALA